MQDIPQNDSIRPPIGMERPKFGMLPQQKAVSPQEAARHRAARKLPENLFQPPATLQADVPLGTPTIADQARALKNNVDLIYQFVHDNIEYIPTYGLHKGGLGALIDGSGNAHDMADLMIKLLREIPEGQQNPAYTCKYVLGSLKLTAAQWSNWLGISDQSVGLASDLLANGGIGVSIVETNKLQIEHCWVQVTIEGSDYVFDPALKTYTYTSGVDVQAAMGYNRTTFLSGANQGSTLTTDYVKDINSSNIDTSMGTFTMNLISWIKTNMPGASMDQILGGRSIVSVGDDPVRQSDLSYRDTTITPSVVTDLPSNEKATMKVEYDLYQGSYTISNTFNTADVYSKRLTLWFDSNYVATLRLDGTQVGSPSRVQAAGSMSDMKITITHPYASNFADAIQLAPIRAGAQIVVGSAWGICSKQMAAIHQEIQNQAIADGKPAASEQMLSISLMLIWDNFMGMGSRGLDIITRLANCTGVMHHFVGTVGQQTYGSGRIKTVNSFLGGFTISKLDNITDVASPGFSTSLLFQTLESVAHQLVTGVESADPLKAIKVANGNSKKIYDARSSNWTTGTNVKSIMQAAGYDSATLTKVENQFINANPAWRVAMPEDAAIQIGSLSNFFAYLGIGPSGGSNSIIGETWFGAKGSVSSNYQDEAETNAAAADNGRQVNGFGLPAATARESAQVNMNTGRYEYSSTDLSIGNQGAPFELSFERSYNSALRLSFFGLGFGWAHNWLMGAFANSDGFIAFGDQQVSGAAPAIAALFVTRDIFKADTTIPINNLVISCIVQEFLSTQLFNNVVRLQFGASFAVFQKLPSTTTPYLNPLGVNGAAKLEYLDVPGSNPVVKRYIFTTAEKVVHTYRTDGLIEKIEFPAGASPIALNFTYEGLAKKLVKVTNGFRELNFTYDLYNQLATVNDGLSHSVTFTIDYNTGNLTEVRDPLNKLTKYEYDQRGRMTKIKKPANPNSPVVTNTYDSLSKVKEQKDAYDNVWKFYLAGSRSEEVAPNGASRILYFNAKGSTLRGKHVLGSEVVLGPVSEYDGLERVTKVTMPEGNSASTTFDANGNVLSITQHAKPGSGLSDRTTSMTYDTVWTSKVKTITDPAGKVTTNTYAGVADNGAGQLVEVKQPIIGGQYPTTTMTYNAKGQLLTSTDPTGKVVSNTYESTKNNLTSTAVDPNGLNIVTSFTYDNVGNVLTTTDPKGNVSSATYDVNRQVTQVTGPAPFNQVSNITYDDNGNVIQVESLASTDANSQITTTAYAIDGKVTQVSGPANFPQASPPVPVRYEYDNMRRVVRVIDPAGRSATTVYDAVSRPVSTSVDGVTQQTTVYTANGQVQSVTDARNKTTSYQRDGFDRPTRVTYPDSSYEEIASYDIRDNVLQARTRAGVVYDFGYDVLSRLTTKETDGQPTVTFGYDLAGRPTSVGIPLVSGDPSTGTFSMFYDGAGRMFKEQYPDGKVVEAASMDKNGNVLQLKYPDGSIVTSAVDQLDRVTSISGFNASVGFVYDTASRRSTQQNGNGTVQGFHYDKADNLFGLTIGALKPNQTLGTPTQLNFAYGLNGTGQSTRKKCSDASFLWEPSLMDTITYGTANNLNQYPTVESVSFSYDTNGCLTSDGVNTFAYDLENKLTSVTTGSGTVSFKYDPFGRLVEKTVGSTKTRYLYSGLQRIEEYNGTSGGLLKRYVYGMGLDEVLFVVDAGTGAITYLHGDETGSTILMTDSTGTPTQRNVYTPWGDLKSGSLSTIQVGYTGQFYEPEVDLYFYKARHYSPKLGRFLQPDPIGYEDGLNMYEYAGSDPVNSCDPLGLQLMTVTVPDKSPLSIQGGVNVSFLFYAGFVGAGNPWQSLAILYLLPYLFGGSSGGGSSTATFSLPYVRPRPDYLKKIAPVPAQTASSTPPSESAMMGMGLALGIARVGAGFGAAATSEVWGPPLAVAGLIGLGILWAQSSTSGNTSKARSGQLVHKSSKSPDPNDPDWKKEYRLPSGDQIDWYNIRTGDLVEDKAFTLANIGKAFTQLNRYAKQLEMLKLPVREMIMRGYPRF